LKFFGSQSARVYLVLLIVYSTALSAVYKASLIYVNNQPWCITGRNFGEIKGVLINPKITCAVEKKGKWILA